MSGSPSTQRFTALHHLVSGGVLALKGFDKLDQGYLYVGASLFALGVLLLAYFAFERFGQDRSQHLSILVHACEGVAFLFLTYLYFAEGKTYLPWVTLVAAIGLLVAALVHARRGAARSHHRLFVRDRREAARFFVDALGFQSAAVGDDVILRRANIEVRLDEGESWAPEKPNLEQ